MQCSMLAPKPSMQSAASPVRSAIVAASSRPAPDDGNRHRRPKAGKVTFEAHNNKKELEYESLLAPLSSLPEEITFEEGTGI